ncbi:GumC family protein [Lichenicoccus sp.]|uniref:GumC family protein n=1 Tax=Lichenicoccus sp. TaxID=2781899 RepID=UPI003D107CD8
MAESRLYPAALPAVPTKALSMDEGFETTVGSGAGVAGPTPLQVALKRKWAILVFALLTTAMVGIVVAQLPPRYAANASMMIDPRQPRLSNGETLLPSQMVDLELLRTYMEGLHSPSLALDVVKQLGLNRNPEFCAPAKHWGGHTAPCTMTVDAAAKKLAGSVEFGNDGRSYVISLTATANDPKLAASIANAYAQAFVNRRRAVQAGLTDQADSWLTSHVAQLRAGLVAADRAVEQQRQAGRLTTLQGQTLLGQSLSGMNTQLVVASGELAQKQSTLAELQDAAKAGPGQLDASATVLSSPIIQGLLQQEAMLASSRVEMEQRLGAANTEVVANGLQIARVRRQIRNEIDKAVTSVRGDVAALAARRAALAASVKALQSQVGVQGVAQTRLADLQSDAVSARGAYDAAATRLEQIRVEAAMQRPDVQLIVEAAPPTFASFPRTRMIVVGTFMAMLGVGAGLAYALELLSRVFSTPEQVEEQTGLRVLGLFPKSTGGRGDRACDPREAEALQAVFAGLIGGRFRGDARAGRVLMVTSAMPGEGKTSFSVALGRAATARNLSVAVLDCDLRRSSLRTHFAQLDPLGTDAEATGAPFADPALEPGTGLHVLVARLNTLNPHAVLASADLPRTLQQLRAMHDVVIIDTPPVLAVPDVLSIAPLVDDVVMLVGWRQTPRASVQAAFKALSRAGIRVNGVVLSKVDLRRFARATTDGSYYARSYPAYTEPLPDRMPVARRLAWRRRAQ